MDVSREDAVAACERVRAANARRYLSAAHWQCWGCMRYGGTDPEKRCMRSEKGWDACTWVNREIEARAH